MSDTHAGHGMKVTTDAAGRQHPIRESAGPVTADSLAAESTRQGGGFAENRNAEPLKVKGANSTFNTTDTSAADVLPPAANAATRSDPDEDYIHFGKGQKGSEDKANISGVDSDSVQAHSQEEDHEKSVSDQHGASKEQKSSVSKDTTPSAGHDGGEQSTVKEPSSGHAGGQDTVGKPTTGSGHEDSEHSTGKKTSSGRGDGEHAAEKQAESDHNQPGVAPTYVETDVINPPIHPKPKGANLTEGGFDSENNNTSNNAEIGSENDPGRLAEAQFQKATTAHITAAATGSGSGLKPKPAVTDDGQYDVLPAEEEA